MRIRWYWQNCDKWSREPVMALWVEATQEEAEIYIFPSLESSKVIDSKNLAEQFKELAAHMGNPARPFCFLVAQDLSSIEPFPVHYPIHQLWNAYSPFDEIPEITITSLDELRNLVLPSAIRGDGGAVPIMPPVPLKAPATPKPDRQMVQFQIGAAVLDLRIGDIVVQDVDAVVNAANTGLTNGSGVSGALHRGAGVRNLESACRPLAPCPTGESRITDGFKLKARHIIHAVGPVYRRADSAESARLLASAYRSSLTLASQHGLHSVAFPSLSTGVFGYPIENAAGVALSAVRDFLLTPSNVTLVRFVLYDQKSFDAYARAADELGLVSVE